MVFNELKNNNWPNRDARFGIGAGALFTILEEAMLEPDHHKWPNIVGDQIRMGGNNVWQILSKEWVLECLDDEPGNSFKENILTKLGAIQNT